LAANGPDLEEIKDMPNYAVDSRKQTMVATGVVGIVQEWEEIDGGRRPSDRQARDEATGMPLWNVEVLYQQASYGRVSSVTAMVAVGSVDEPKVTPLTQVGFEGLRVEVRVNKAKALVEAWSADALAAAAPTSARSARSGGEG